MRAVCNGIEEGQFPEIALGLGGLETRVGTSEFRQAAALGEGGHCPAPSIF